jgi:hypothetical protein
MKFEIVYNTVEETERSYNYIMDICVTMTRLEISNLKDRYLSASRSMNNGEKDLAASKIAQVRAIVDFLFETHRIDHHLMGELHKLTAMVMGINKAIED